MNEAKIEDLKTKITKAKDSFRASTSVAEQTYHKRTVQYLAGKLVREMEK